MSEMLTRKRIQSVDMLRGLAMVIMALDHVRDFFHVTANTADPLDLSSTTPVLFFTRWITHFCAPIFVFLSGTSIYLQSLRKSRRELGLFLVKRGLWLIFAEWVIIAFAWTFNPYFHFIPFQVIWAIGISMLIMGLMIGFGMTYRWILLFGLIIVLGHNLLDIPESKAGFQPGFVWDMLHSGSFKFYPVAGDHKLILVYPFLPWVGLMLLGYAFGVMYAPGFDAKWRKKILLQTGLGLILFFFALRWLNIYGDPHPWSHQKDSVFTFLSLLNVHKYPPSLLYTCITLGPAMLMLAWMENWNPKPGNVLLVFGRTAFFYYILHLYLIHVLATLLYFWRGHTVSEALPGLSQFPFTFVVPGEGFSLGATYLVWILVILMLYPVCRAYDRYKTSHKEKWWLSYL